MKIRLPFALGILAISAALVAQTPATKPMAAPKPSARLAELQYFAGSWDCTGTAFASMLGPEHATHAHVDAMWTLDNYWLEIHYAEQKSPQNAMPFSIRIFETYDEGLKKFVSGSVDNMGGYSTEESAGWNGNTMVLWGPNHAGGMEFTGRDTFTKKSANEVWHLFEAKQKDGSWKKLAEETCRKK